MDGWMDRRLWMGKRRRERMGQKRYAPKDMSLAVKLGGPFCLAAVAFALVGRHDCRFVLLLRSRG